MNECNVLVLEDEALIAIDIEMTLEEAGHRNIIVCHSAEDALAQIDRAKPQIALLDVNLGKGQTSIPVAERLHDLGVPFFFLSGYTEATVSLPEGLKTVKRMSKPFQNAELVAAVQAMIDLSRRVG